MLAPAVRLIAVTQQLPAELATGTESGFVQIFLLYTRKLQLASRGADRADRNRVGAVETDGLGFAATAGEVVPVSLTVTDPWTAAVAAASAGEGDHAAPADLVGRGKSKRRRAKKLPPRARDDVTVQVELHQSLDALRHRKGDTGTHTRCARCLSLSLCSLDRIPPPPSPPKSQVECRPFSRTGLFSVIPCACAGSVLWRLRYVTVASERVRCLGRRELLLTGRNQTRLRSVNSLHLAEYFLRMHHFPHPSSGRKPAFLPFLADSTVLELGSGTGFLGLALRDVVLAPSSRGRWCFSDQWANLPLVVRNLRAHGVLDPQPPPPSSSSSQQTRTRAGEPTWRERPRVEVLELDWLAEAAEWDREQQRECSSSDGPAAAAPPLRERSRIHDDGINSPGADNSGPLVLLAVDCIYNPSLSAPLAKTLLRQARLWSRGAAADRDRDRTVIVVASELRDEEPLEAFLRAWTDATRQDRDRGGGSGGWTIARLGWDDADADEEPDPDPDADADNAPGLAGELASGQYVVWVAWWTSSSAAGLA